MRLPFVSRAKYDRQVGWARLWERSAKREQAACIAAEKRYWKAEEENRELRYLLRAAERKLAKFERTRGGGGRFSSTGAKMGD